MASNDRHRSEPPTTGHEWDGIREYNNPLPRWWLYVFYACIVWAIGYWIAMPAWPLISGYTRGVLGYSQRAEVARRLKEEHAAQSVYLDQIRTATLQQINSNPELLSFALAAGRSAFAVNCTPCHGTGAQGSPGYPNLNDDDWLWGGTLDDIAYTITNGVRNGGDKARESQMPAFGKDELLDAQQIDDVVEYVVSLSGRTATPDAAKRGAEIFATNCAPCHGANGKGSQQVGAPNLTDDIWLYGGDRKTIRETVFGARRGVMPAWKDRLSPETIKELAVYVHSLGGGK